MIYVDKDDSGKAFWSVKEKLFAWYKQVIQ